jgi:hypothetical protein
MLSLRSSGTRVSSERGVWGSAPLFGGSTARFEPVGGALRTSMSVLDSELRAAV